MNCPRCQTVLTLEVIKEINQNIEIDRCPNCQGIWFDEGELQSLDHISEPVFFEWRKIPKTHDQLDALHCPKCEEHPLLKKEEHPRDNKVIFDYCEDCLGVWLDHGELEAIQKESWFSAIISFWQKLH